MEKLLFVLGLCLISSVTLWSQSDHVEFKKKTEYKKETGGRFYVLVPIENSNVDEDWGELKLLIEMSGFESIRSSRLPFGAEASGSILVARVFDDKASANSLLELVEGSTLLSKYNPVVISITNYRILLRTKDFKGYRDFLENQE